jgi:hypothetical protein
VKYGIDAGCQQEVMGGAEHCGPVFNDSLKQCWKVKLSSVCFDQVNSPPSVKRDSVCVQEVEKSNAQCTPEAMSATAQCMKKTLSANCSQQQLTVAAKMEKSRMDCEPKMRAYSDGLRSCFKMKTEIDQTRCLDTLPKPNCR